MGSIYDIIFLKNEKFEFQKKNSNFFLDPVDKNSPPGSPNGPFGPIFFLRLTTIDKLEFTAYSQLRHPFLSYSNLPISVAYGIFTPSLGLTSAI